MAHLTHLDYLPGTFFGPSTLVEVVRHRARNQPKDTAFIYLVDGETQQVRLTYEELDRKARSIGAWLESLDLVGQRALLLYPAGLDFVAGFLGCLYAGVVAVPVYPPRRNRSLERIQAIADDAEAKVALTTDAVLGRIEALIDETPHLKELSWLDTCHLPEGLDERWQLPDIHGDTLAFLQYTSGSTGTPKGVVLNHANLVHNSALISHAFEHTRSCMGVFWLPSYHDMGLIGGILQPLYIGRPNVLMSPMTFLQKPYRWLSAISRFAATTSGGPNFAYDLCVQKVTAEQRKTLDLSRWTVAFNGAEPVRAETLDRFSEVFEPCGFRREAFYPCFGLAEATLIVSGGYVAKPPVVRDFQAQALANNRVVPSAPGAAGGRRLVGCGETLPDQKIAIADPEDLTTCPPGWIGEIWVHGTSVAQGYWRQPAATDATFHAYLKDSGEGPFLRTGDLGFIEDGELFVTGRLKDLIIVHGTNYYPQDVERTVQQSHPRLRRDCGAAFTAERDGREELVVVQEVERHKKADFGPVFRAIRRAVAGQHDLHLDAIVLVKAGSIPKTSSGKIQRHACRNGYLNGTLDVVGRWHAGEALPETREAAEEPPAAARPQRAGAGGGGLQERLPHRRQEGKAHGTSAGRDSPRGQGSRRRPDPRFADHRDRLGLAGADGDPRFAGRALRRPLSPGTPSPVGDRPATDRRRGAAPGSGAARAGGPARRRAARRDLPLRTLSRVPRAPPALGPLGGAGGGQSVLQRPPGDHQRPHRHRRPRADQLCQLQLRGDVGRPAGVEGRQGGHRPLRHQRLGQPPGVRREGPARRVGAGDRPLPGHRGGLELRGRTFHQRDGHRPPRRPRRPGAARCPGAQQHHPGRADVRRRRRPFAHNDHEAADALLAQFRHEYRRVLMVIEGVYSMDGDIPDLPRFVAVKKRHKALLMIDEAHSLGVLGRRGRGIGEHFGVPARDVDVWMGTMSKTLGSCGGYIAGSKELIEYLKYTVPGFVFSVGLPPAGAAAALAALRLLEAEPGRVARLRENARLFLTLARTRGLNTGTSQDSAVVPVILGNSLSALRLSQALLARGINVQPILHPAVEESAARLRFFITSLHTEEQIRHTVEVLAEEWEKLGRQAVAQATGS